MKVAFYLDFSNMAYGGIYPYAKGVLMSLIDSEEVEKIYIVHKSSITKDLDCFMFSPKVVPVPFKRTKFKQLRILISHFLMNTYYLYKDDFEAFIPGFKSSRLKKLAFSANPIRKVVNKLDADVFHIPLQSLPVYGVKKPLVVTVHDVQELHFPQFFPSAERMRRAISFKVSIDEADEIVVWFQHVKNDMTRFFAKDPDAVDVCMPNVVNNWYVGRTPTEWSVLSEKFDLKKPFIFYPSATWEHKNHFNLIEAVKILLDKGIDIQLYCTGSSAPFHPNIVKKVEELNLQDRVKFLGIVSEDDLLGMYRNTELVVLPSFYEGGGIPAFEAMRLQVPVICSDIYAFRQSIHDTRFMFDPHSPQSIAESIERNFQNEELNKANLENGEKRIEYFENIKFSENFVNAYRKAIAKKASEN